MMKRYTAYMLAPPKREQARIFFNADELASQEKALHHFIQECAGELVGTFVEVKSNHKQRHVWPELKNAIEACQRHQAILVIPEIRNLTNNDGFSKLILQAIKYNNYQNNFEIICLDQPFINRDNFEALVLHSKEQRKYHGKLIKEGFDRSKAHPGNPHAAQVLNQINRSKIDNAIIFALLMKPIIYDYQIKGYSQRQMVDMLNQEGFTAPEGGKWVLSQFQKLLERIKFNDSALVLEPWFKKMDKEQASLEVMAQALNQSDYESPCGQSWTTDCVDKVAKRVEQLQNIILLNNLLIELQPLFEEHHIDDLTDDMLLNELKNKGVRLPKNWIRSDLRED